MLPGITPFFSSGAGTMNVTFQSSSNATTGNGSFTMPASIVAGDIILVMNIAMNSSATYPTAAYGTGFTSLRTNTAQDTDTSGKSTVTRSTRTCHSYKISDGTESSTSIGGFVNASAEFYTVFVYRPSKLITSVTLSGGTVTSSADGNPGNITITASSSSSPATIICSHQSSALSTTFTGTFTGETEDTDEDDGITDLGYSRVVGINETPSDVTVTYTTSSGGTSAQINDGWYLEIT